MTLEFLQNVPYLRPQPQYVLARLYKANLLTVESLE